MQQIDLGSSYIKAVARVAHNTMLCTSQGLRNPIALGKPELVTAQGVSEYGNPSLAAQSPHPLKVFALGGFAMIVDPSVAVDISTEAPDVELAVFVPSSATHVRIAALGQEFPAAWFEQADDKIPSTILDDGYLVSRVTSPQWDFAVVAATPQSYIYQRVGHFALFFVPIGALCGLALSLMAGLVSRMHSSFRTMLRRAIKDGSLYVLYQPVVELSTRRIVGAEAVVRWRTSYADMRPDYFILQAEQCGLIQLVTQQVLDMVAHDLPEFIELDAQFRVAINMSAADLRDRGTLDAMDRFLAASGARPQNVELEATERAFLESPEIAAIIGALRDKGFGVAIDDFGTGYSSLACLQSLSLDTIKIDRAFVETIGANGATSQLVLHIIEMAHSLHLDMIAEGVENELQAQFLQQHGVRFAQGWQFGRPMDIAPLCELLRVQEGIVLV